MQLSTLLQFDEKMQTKKVVVSFVQAIVVSEAEVII